MSATDKLKAYIPEIQNATAAAIIEDTEQAFKELCNVEAIPDEASSLIVEMAVMRYNRLGSEGLASQGYSGASESFINGLPDDLLRRLGKYRRLKTL